MSTPRRLVVAATALLTLMGHVTIFAIAAAGIVLVGNREPQPRPVDAAEAYPGIDLSATAVDDALTLTVTAGNDDVVVLRPDSYMTIDEVDGRTRWVWESPPNDGGDAGVAPETRPGRLVSANTTVELIADPSRDHPIEPWEVCTDVAAPGRAIRSPSSDPADWAVPPERTGGNPDRLCATVDTVDA